MLVCERGDGKIQGWHRDRLAVVYVRQSSRQQVADHGESTRLQYGLADRAVALGWSASRVMVIDEDLGRSAANAAERPGFARLVAEITMGHVGLVMGLDMSRLARAGRDWHQLIELCCLAGALLADADGVYDPNWYNDRLLLGLKGTMTEVELHLVKQRMASGRLAKAGRGSWRCRCRPGMSAGPLVRLPSTPMSRSRRSSGWCSACSSSWARCTRCCGSWWSTRSRSGCGSGLGPARARLPGGRRTSRAWSICCATRRMPGSTPTGAAAPSRPGGCPGTSTPAGCAAWTPGSGWCASTVRCRPISAPGSTSATWHGWPPTGRGPRAWAPR